MNLFLTIALVVLAVLSAVLLYTRSLSRTSNANNTHSCSTPRLWLHPFARIGTQWRCRYYRCRQLFVVAEYSMDGGREWITHGDPVALPPQFGDCDY